ncbi:MAG: hypothetical protein ACTTJL_07170 [Hoylesella enoeca]|uniref:hypothetical protein n=1 Tax=Hoylesella enoeca TaxID=76123 RepID=UPI003F9FE947
MKKTKSYVGYEKPECEVLCIETENEMLKASGNAGTIGGGGSGGDAKQGWFDEEEEEDEN